MLMVVVQKKKKKGSFNSPNYQLLFRTSFYHCITKTPVGVKSDSYFVDHDISITVMRI